MSGISNNSYAPISCFLGGAFVFYAGCMDEKERPSLARNQKIVGGALMLGAIIERVLFYSGAGMPFVGAQTTSLAEDGESWMGNHYPYSQYPHGHFDCAHGSTVYDPLRSADNELSRQRLFRDSDICIRGIGDLILRVGNTVLTCFSDGTKSSHTD